MRVGIFTIDIFIPGSQNLKEKRAVIKSIKAKLRNNFNVSLIESDHHDKWQKATLAIATLGTKNAIIDSCFANIIDFLDRNNQIQLIDHKMEII